MPLVINGNSVAQPLRLDATLLEIIRGEGLTGSKESCGRGECGACTVLIDDQPHLSCMVLASLVEGQVTTVEGLGPDADALRETIAERGGLQCGYCTPGMVVHGVALMRAGIEDEHKVRKALSGNVCRCTGYDGLIDAIVISAGQNPGRL